jgi:DNA-binding PadR family transcriptional regulator
VYPRLAKLADDGLITGIRTGRRVVYTITERGQLFKEPLHEPGGLRGPR